MAFKEFDFQNNALNKLYDAFIGKKENVILQAPTGAGKTAILIKLMDRILENSQGDIAFVWLTPGAGELEEQSWEKTSKNSTLVKPQFLSDALISGFNKGTVTFLNWEIITKKGNIALRDGEKTNLPQAVHNAKERNIKFILVIDEEHKNQTDKAQAIINIFDGQTIFRTSATPIQDNRATKVIITEDDVISEGLITRNVIINDQFISHEMLEDLRADDQEFLDIAEQKRYLIKNEYKKINENINPLVLIQFPDEKASELEVESKIEEVKKYLIDELGQTPETIAIWLSGKHINLEEIEKNDSSVNYLLMKQAVSTGWDAPRAKILIKLRLNTSYRFTVQTIGRIRRMPQQKHYNNELLDNSYVYSNDEKYIYEIIKKQLGAGLVQMGLKKEVDPNIFDLKNVKRKIITNNDLDLVTNRLHLGLKSEFNLTRDTTLNKEILEKNGFKFGTTIYTDIPSGSVNRLEDLVNLATVSVNIPIVDTRQWGYRYDAVMKALLPYLHIGYDLKNMRAIIADLISYGEPGSSVQPLLQLRPKERYAFIINNAKKILEVVKYLDAQGTFDIQETMYSYIDSENYTISQIKLKLKEGYLDSGEKEDLLNKNIYSGYSKSNWINQSKPEKLFEELVESIPEIEWIFRSKDHGNEYFSVPYSDRRYFYPDYLIKTKNGVTYIIEVKGAENENIDTYSKAKFNALKKYINENNDPNIRFAFVRPSKKYEGTMVYNNSEWEDKVEGSNKWLPLLNLFR